MKYFVLEDDMMRIHKFQQELNGLGDSVTICKTASEAKKILSEDQFDFLLLDHDLGDRVFVDSNDPNTGYQVAKFIVENNIQYKRAVVHSLNENGAKNILSLLKDAEWIPFFNLFRK